ASLQSEAAVHGVQECAQGEMNLRSCGIERRGDFVQLRQRAGVQRVERKLACQDGQQRPRRLGLVVAQGGDGKQDFCVGLKVVSLGGGAAQLLDSGGLVGGGAVQAQKPSHRRRAQPQHVVLDSDRQVGV